ncbi:MULTISPECIES: hypothetical protein [unclassified Burkholderia]|uniref:hypothetical protein n=1 Tax=unclassified Burkholderia TaxID=2613784 RepID=UPI000B0528E6|nr:MULTISPECIES: hypothetical protein [unclassified Burkholderia]
MKLLADVPDALRRAGIAVGNQDAGGVAVEQERLGALEDGRGIHEYSRAGEVARIEFRGSASMGLWRDTFAFEHEYSI